MNKITIPPFKAGDEYLSVVALERMREICESVVNMSGYNGIKVVSDSSGITITFDETLFKRKSVSSGGIIRAMITGFITGNKAYFCKILKPDDTLEDTTIIVYPKIADGSQFPLEQDLTFCIPNFTVGNIIVIEKRRDIRPGTNTINLDWFTRDTFTLTCTT